MIDIEGFENLYAITNDGQIWSYRKQIFLKPQFDKNGYIDCILHNKGFKKHVKVHRLVAKYFIPNPENKSDVNHIDGNKSNNHYTNLEWTTRLENITHAWNNNLINLNNRYRKLSEHDVHNIKKLLADGTLTQRSIANLYNVSPPVICYIKRQYAGESVA